MEFKEIKAVVDNLKNKTFLHLAIFVSLALGAIKCFGAESGGNEYAGNNAGDAFGFVRGCRQARRSGGRQY